MVLMPDDDLSLNIISDHAIRLFDHNWISRWGGKYVRSVPIPLGEICVCDWKDGFFVFATWQKSVTMSLSEWDLRIFLFFYLSVARASLRSGFWGRAERRNWGEAIDLEDCNKPRKTVVWREQVQPLRLGRLKCLKEEFCYLVWSNLLRPRESAILSKNQSIFLFFYLLRGCYFRVPLLLRLCGDKLIHFARAQKTLLEKRSN